mmetsp:Transcript_10418/g.29730  ORF Transcript_10418/g.29730 Transcript_10418/m.29730 type:complete len:254 (+) Transcript_10418:80-841(+)
MRMSSSASMMFVANLARSRGKSLPNSCGSSYLSTRCSWSTFDTPWKKASLLDDNIWNITSFQFGFDDVLNSTGRCFSSTASTSADASTVKFPTRKTWRCSTWGAFLSTFRVPVRRRPNWAPLSLRSTEKSATLRMITMLRHFCTVYLLRPSAPSAKVDMTEPPMQKSIFERSMRRDAATRAATGGGLNGSRAGYLTGMLRWYFKGKRLRTASMFARCAGRASGSRQLRGDPLPTPSPQRNSSTSTSPRHKRED